MSKLEQEPTTKNCESCRYYGSHHEVCNYCYNFSLWTEVEPTPKNDLGVDAVSRKAVINQIFYSTDNNGDVVLGSALRERIARLPSVTPQEPRRGHWIDTHDNAFVHFRVYKCSYCGAIFCDYPKNLKKYKYCSDCGCRMVEPQESEEQTEGK